MKCVRVVAAVVEHEGRYLITQRRAEATFPFTWEFPGGRVEEGETDASALAREFRHRVGVEVQCGDRISEIEHVYPSYSLRLVLYSCSITSGEPRAVAVAAAKWVRCAEFANYTFTPADEASIAAMLGMEDKLS